MSTNICLGSAQFGMDYGITNPNGKVPEYIAREILEFAALNNISYIDTAQSYGSAEQVIGKLVPCSNDFKISTKLAPGLSSEFWTTSLNISLAKLKLSSIYGLLIHNSKDLLGAGGASLISWLKSVKSKGLVSKVGVSIYSKSELNSIDLDAIDIVQLPVSIYNQSLILDGTIKLLKDYDIEIHARSIFMQGLIIRTPEFWPEFISSEFKNHHGNIVRKANEAGISMLDLSIQFINQIECIDVAIVGVDNLPQLSSILTSQRKFVDISEFRQSLAWTLSNEYDPRFW